MEECCAVCAEPLEWIAFGTCGHREVCSTCTARMRVILNDKQCCICKQVSPYIFVTKALGDYTRSIGDFSLLPQLVGNGKEKLWYDRSVEGYFDDEEEYKRIKATCKLYCTICENASLSEDMPTGFIKQGHTFKTLELLRLHIFGVHKLLMCSLCLEGRKVFISEQKLYTKAELECHSSDGNSKADGSEEERGGFGGHPLCAFCKKRFYGDNELYQHMSVDHYTCHLCQRVRPGQFEYYHNYDDLEIHFRHEHVLCEHPDCLAQKFIVFPGEAEFKRHNATSHGGNMSRAQRHAALQIPVSFQVRRSGLAAHEDRERQYHRGHRGRFRDINVLPSSMEMETGNNVANLEESLRLSSFFHTSRGADSSSSMVSTGHSDTFPALVGEVPGAATPSNSNSEIARYLEVAQGASLSLQNSKFPELFPPLPGKSKTARHRANQRNRSAPLSMAALVGGGRGGGIRVLNTARSKQSRSVDVPRTSISKTELAGHSLGNAATLSGEQENSRVSLKIHSEGREPAVCAALGSGPPSDGEDQTIPSRRMPCVDQEAVSDCHGKLNVDEIRAANKALVEQIKASLHGDEQQFADFKNISSLFRKGEMGADEFYNHIVRLGLPHVIQELVRLCPDLQRQEELQKVHIHGQSSNKTLDDESWLSIASTSSCNSGKIKVEQTPKGKGLTMMQDEEVEILHIDGYQTAKGKHKVGETASFSRPTGENVHHNKKPPKISKFERVRLGEVSAGAGVSGSSRESSKASTEFGVSKSFGRGVWKKQGGQRILSLAQRDSVIDEAYGSRH